MQTDTFQSQVGRDNHFTLRPLSNFYTPYLKLFQCPHSQAAGLQDFFLLTLISHERALHAPCIIRSFSMAMAGFHDKGLQEVGARQSRSYRSLPLIETTALFGAIASLCINIEYAQQLSNTPPDLEKTNELGQVEKFNTV